MLESLGSIVIISGIIIFILGVFFLDAHLFDDDPPVLKILGALFIVTGVSILFISSGYSLVGYVFLGAVVLGFIYIGFIMGGEKKSFLDFIGMEAIVQDPPQGSSIGEIKIVSQPNKRFLAQPAFKSRNKTFKKGQRVYIVGFTGIIAEIDDILPVSLMTHQRTVAAQPSKERGSKIADCVVCYLPIYENEEWLKTPCCQASSHTKHLLEWVKIKGECPHCHKPLQIGTNATVIIKQ